jgi:hypothetical protein
VRLFTTMEEASKLLPSLEALLEPASEGVVLTAQVPTEYLASLALKLLELPSQLEVLEPRALQEAFVTLGKRAVALGKHQPRKILRL